MNFSLILVYSTLSLLLTGCKALDPAASENSDSIYSAVDAIIPKHTPNSIAELQLYVSQVVTEGKVTLTENAFAQQSKLSIERTPIKTLQGPIVGRSLETPHLFLLILENNQQCVLIHQQSQQHWVLQEAKCVARE
ncbi:hypothetical protein [Aliikangiella maris]|uniref:Uncharacterized protein n=3 Tax=Aliikangiella maris TaxID=3162458 RepID=A0ABV2BR38_9GAMM